MIWRMQKAKKLLANTESLESAFPIRHYILKAETLSNRCLPFAGEIPTRYC
jgi:hypothetical protein